MDRTEMLQLMHAVLDGAASSDERAALDRLLAQDAQARTQFADLARLFGALDDMPRLELPASFADDVMAALQRSEAAAASTRQPFAQSGVIAPTGSDIRVRAPSKPITARTPSGPIRGSQSMSKRGYWIIGGVAAAVLALFVGTSVDFPAGGDKATGTIVPAERYRAAQPKAEDVKLGEPTATPSRLPNEPKADPNLAGQAASQAAGQAARQAAGQEASQAARQAAGQEASQAARQAAGQAAGQSAGQAMQVR